MLVSELEQMVVRMVFESYGVYQHHDSHKESTTYLFRMMKYRGPEKNEANVGCDAHTDKSFITVLHQNQVSGLEVKSKDGQWMGFKPSPSSFIVMAGDALLVGHSRLAAKSYARNHHHRLYKLVSTGAFHHLHCISCSVFSYKIICQDHRTLGLSSHFNSLDLRLVSGSFSR
jgi:hypothetical protein